jgi:hypothetical protein
MTFSLMGCIRVQDNTKVAELTRQVESLKKENKALKKPKKTKVVKTVIIGRGNKSSVREETISLPITTNDPAQEEELQTPQKQQQECMI